MSDNDYRTVAGFVQFDVETAEVNNQTVRRVVIQSTGSEGANISITLWPEWDGTDVERGDFLVVNGKFEVREGKGDRTFLNITSVSRLVVFKGAEKSETGVTKKGSSSKRPF